MNKIILITVIIIAAFILGGVAGILYQTAKDASLVAKAAKADLITKELSSQVVPSIIAYGKATNIAGRDITITFGSDSVTIKIKDDASVSGYIPDNKGKASQQNINFSQIKIGDNLNIAAQLLPDGTLQGESIVVFPVAPATKK